MAITFGKQNIRIRDNLRQRCIGDNLQGLSSYTDFCFRDIDDVNYATGIFIFSGTRIDLYNYSNRNATWHTDAYLQNHSNCLAFWEQHNAWSGWPHSSYGFPYNTAYVQVRPYSVQFTPSFLTLKQGMRSGTATWFVVQTRYSSTSYGLLSGTVGNLGSGADMEIQICNSSGDQVSTDTYIDTGKYVNVPRGLTLHSPPPPL